MDGETKFVETTAGWRLAAWIAAVSTGLVTAAIVWLWGLYGESVYLIQLTSFIATCF
ncbi:MAG: hypothetical protein R3D32_08425 [Nitratireductor sp.]